MLGGIVRGVCVRVQIIVQDCKSRSAAAMIFCHPN